LNVQDYDDSTVMSSRGFISQLL